MVGCDWVDGYTVSYQKDDADTFYISNTVGNNTDSYIFRPCVTGKYRVNVTVTNNQGYSSHTVRGVVEVNGAYCTGERSGLEF